MQENSMEDSMGSQLEGKLHETNHSLPTADVKLTKEMFFPVVFAIC